jgi:glycosyltransferase involved in cell wall biosynthesis
LKVAIISEAPNRTTGFGATTRHIVRGLTEAGHSVVCFGIGAIGETFDRTLYSCKIWAVGNTNLVPTLGKFIEYESPDAIIISYDLTSVQRWFNLCRGIGWNGPIHSYFVMDGIPFSKEYLSVLEKLSGKITATKTVADYLHEKGFLDVLVAPHGVDMEVFRPLEHRGKIRSELEINDKFVVGVFGRNVERKQQARVLLALKRLRDLGKDSNLLVYFHCQPKDNIGFRGWNLINIAENLGIDDLIRFPHEGFQQINGVPLHKRSGFVERISTNTSFLPTNLNYVERINMCDMIINVPFCGGFELSILEAQASGVPIAITNDQGIMAEVGGDGVLLLDADDTGIWHTGATQHFISHKTIAETIVYLRDNPKLRDELKNKGFMNVKKYPWKLLEETILKVL